MTKVSQLSGFNNHFKLPAKVVMDLNAALGVTKNNENKVSVWADSSNLHNDAYQANNLLQPTWVNTYFNSWPAITFDGKDEYLAITNTIFERTYTVNATIIAVWKKESNQDDIRRFFDATSTSNQFQMGLGCGYDSPNSNKGTAYAGKSIVLAQNATDGKIITSGTKLITSGTWSGGYVHFWKGTDDVGSVAINSTVQSASNNTNGWSIGAGRENDNTVFPANVSITRLIMWNRKLSNEEVSSVIKQFATNYL